jgi:alkylresorcinol/alkylpyrone synthase
MPSPTIVATATALPRHVLHQESVKRVLCEVLPIPARQLAAAMALFDHALVERRASVLPLEELRVRRSLTETTLIYRDHAVRLGREVARRCLEEAAVDPAVIDLVITVSCTGVMIPSLDAHLANDLGLRTDIRRLPLTELGCVGGAAALARATDFLLGRPDGHVLVVAVELPTLSFQQEDVTVPQLVSTALFGDGAAAAVLRGARFDDGGDGDSGVSDGSRGRGARVLATRSHLFPHTLGSLGFDLREDGFHVVLAKDLPERLRGDLANVVDRLLDETQLRRADLQSFVLHPGGRRILAALEDALSIARPMMQPSWDVLRDHGNVSSAAVLFVLDRWVRQHCPPPRTHGLLGAFGPGLTAELCVLQWN